MKRLVKTLATRQPIAIPKKQGTAKWAFRYASGAVTLFGLWHRGRHLVVSLGQVPWGGDSWKFREVKAAGQSSDGEGVTEKEPQRPSESPQVLSGALTSRQCEKDLQLGKTSAKMRKSCLRLTQGPSACSHQPDWKNWPFTGRRGEELGKPRLSLSGEHDQPGTERCPEPAHQTVKLRPERIALFPSNFTRSQNKVQEDSQDYKITQHPTR